MNEEPTPRQEISVIDALPGLARVAAELWWRTAWWGLEVSVRVGTRMVEVALDPEAAAELAQEFSQGMRAYAREFLGVADLDDRVRQMAPASSTLSRRGRRNGSEPEPISLRTQGADCCAKPRMSRRRTTRIPLSLASSPSSRPTRRASCAC